MKKVALLSSIALILCATQAESQTIKINGETLTGVEVKSINLSAGVLSLTTKNGESIGIVDGNDSGNGGTTDPDPTPDPDPDPEPGTDPGTEDPGETQGCTPSTAIECAYHFSAADWQKGVTKPLILTVPKAKTLVSAFTASASDGAAGSFSFQTYTGQQTPKTRVWVSTTPNGEALSATCDRTGQFVYTLAWSQFPYRMCSLEPGTSYFLNIKHVDPKQGAVIIMRSLSNNGR